MAKKWDLTGITPVNEVGAPEEKEEKKWDLTGITPVNDPIKKKVETTVVTPSSATSSSVGGQSGQSNVPETKSQWPTTFGGINTITPANSPFAAGIARAEQEAKIKETTTTTQQPVKKADISTMPLTQEQKVQFDLEQKQAEAQAKRKGIDFSGITLAPESTITPEQQAAKLKEGESIAYVVNVEDAFREQKKQVANAVAQKTGSNDLLKNQHDVFYMSEYNLEDFKDELFDSGLPKFAVDEYIQNAQKDYLNLLGESRKDSEYEKNKEFIKSIPGITPEEANSRINTLMAKDVWDYGVNQLDETDKKYYPLLKEYADIRSKISTASPEQKDKMVLRLRELDSQISPLREGTRVLYDPITGKNGSEEYTQMVKAAEEGIKKTPQDKIFDTYKKSTYKIQGLNDELNADSGFKWADGRPMSKKDLSQQYTFMDPALFDNFDITKEVASIEKIENVYRQEKAKYDALNRFVLFNEDPGSLEHGGFFTSFGESLGENFAKMIPGVKLDIKTNSEQAKQFTDVVSKEGIPLTEDQKKMVETRFSEQAGSTIGMMVPMIAEFVATAPLSGGIASFAKGSKAANILKAALDYDKSKAGKFAYELIEGGVENAIKFKTASTVFNDENVTGTQGFGGGVAETFVSNLLLINAKFARVAAELIKTGSRITSEMFSEYAEDFTQALVDSGFDIKESFKSAIGRDYDEAKDKFLLIGLVSAASGGAAGVSNLIMAKNHYESTGDKETVAQIEALAKEKGIDLKQAAEQIKNSSKKKEDVSVTEKPETSAGTKTSKPTVESAVIEIGGKTYEGKNHAEAILKAKADGQDISGVDRQAQGKFKLSDGTIINRAEAKKEFGQDRSELMIPQDAAADQANAEYSEANPINSRNDLPSSKTNGDLDSEEVKNRNTELFPDESVFGGDNSEEGKLKEKAKLSSYREVNGVGSAEYTNPKTGVVDVYISARNDNSYAAFIRIYDSKGNPTNRFTSKFENTNGSKSDFKQMIQNAQENLPEGHEYTEDTSISTDGLRVYEQQLSRGYEILRDKNGNPVTNEVAINGDSKTNILGIPVPSGFSNISAKTQADFNKVKAALKPFVERLGLTENDIIWEGSGSGKVSINLPVLKSTKTTNKSNIVTESSKTEVPTVLTKEEVAIKTKEADDLMIKGINDFTVRRDELVKEGKTIEEAEAITEQEWLKTEDGKKYSVLTQELSNQAELVATPVVENTATQEEILEDKLLPQIKLAMDSGVDTGLRQNSKGAVWIDRNTPKFEKLGYSESDVDNMSQEEVTGILENNIEKPVVESSAKVQEKTEPKTKESKGFKRARLNELDADTKAKLEGVSNYVVQDNKEFNDKIVDHVNDVGADIAIEHAMTMSENISDGSAQKKQVILMNAGAMKRVEASGKLKKAKADGDLVAQAEAEEDLALAYHAIDVASKIGTKAGQLISVLAEIHKKFPSTFMVQAMNTIKNNGQEVLRDKTIFTDEKGEKISVQEAIENERLKIEEELREEIEKEFKAKVDELNDEVERLKQEPSKDKKKETSEKQEKLRERRKEIISQLKKPGGTAQATLIPFTTKQIELIGELIANLVQSGGLTSKQIISEVVDVVKSFNAGAKKYHVQNIAKSINEFNEKLSEESVSRYAKGLELVKSNLKKQIEVLEQEIETREKVVSDKNIYNDQELSDLKEKRDELKVIRDEIFKDDSVSSAEKLKKAEKALEKSIEDYKKKIEGIDDEVIEKEVLDSPRLKELTGERDSLKEELNKLRDERKVKKTPEEAHNDAKLRSVESKIAEIEKRLASNDLINKKSAQSLEDSSEVKEAKKKLKELQDELKRRQDKSSDVAVYNKLRELDRKISEAQKTLKEGYKKDAKKKDLSKGNPLVEARKKKLEALNNDIEKLKESAANFGPQNMSNAYGLTPKKLKEIVMSHLFDRKGVPQSLTKTIIDHTGMDIASARLIADSLSKSIIDPMIDKVVDKKTESILATKKDKKSTNKKTADRVKDLIKQGVLSNGSNFQQAFEGKFGFRSIDPRTGARMKDIIQQVEELERETKKGIDVDTENGKETIEIDITQREKILGLQREFNNILQSLTPLNAAIVLTEIQSGIFISILSDVSSTSWKALVGSFGSMVTGLTSSAIKGIPNPSLRGPMALFLGIPAAASRAATALRSGLVEPGEVRTMGEFGGEKQSRVELAIMEGTRDALKNKETGKAAGKFVGNILKNVRILAALDAFLVSSMGSYYNAIDGVTPKEGSIASKMSSENQEKVFKDIASKEYDSMKSDITNEVDSEIKKGELEAGKRESEINRRSKKEVRSIGDPRVAYMNKRVQELRESQAKESFAKGWAMAKYFSLIGKSDGYLGAGIDVIQRLTAIKPTDSLQMAASKFVFGMAFKFLNLMGNFYQASVNSIPVIGVVNSYLGKGYDPIKKEYVGGLTGKYKANPRLAHTRAITNGIITTAILAVLSDQLKWDDEKDEWVLDPDRNMDFRGFGFGDWAQNKQSAEDYEEFSFSMTKDKNGKFINYHSFSKFIPQINAIVATVSAITDNMKGMGTESKLRYSESNPIKGNIGRGLESNLKAFLEGSFNSLGRLSKPFMYGNDSFAEKLTEVVTNAVVDNAGAITRPNAVNALINYGKNLADLPAKERKTIEDKVFNALYIGEWINKDKTDPFGNPIPQSDDVERFFTEIQKQSDLYPKTAGLMYKYGKGVEINKWRATEMKEFQNFAYDGDTYFATESIKDEAVKLQEEEFNRLATENYKELNEKSYEELNESMREYQQDSKDFAKEQLINKYLDVTKKDSKIKKVE